MNRRLFLAGCGAAVGTLAYAGEIARHELQVTEIALPIAGLSSVFHGLRIAQISDIHLAEYTEDFFLRHVVHRVNALAPDLVLITGDFVSDGPRSNAFSLRAAGRCAEILSELTCPLRFGILGNHDWFVGSLAISQALKSAGLPVLINQRFALERSGARLWICGLDDAYAGTPDLAATLPGSNTDPVLLMLHEPDYLDTLLKKVPGARIDLVVSGHTHGGQVRLPFLPPLHLPPLGQKYIEGLFHVGATQLYVNRGVGTVDVPFRLLCPPEITLFTLEAQRDTAST